VAAPLALTRETGGSDLLEIAPTNGRHRQDADDAQNNADPPVPNVRCKHGLMVATGPSKGLVTSEAAGQRRGDKCLGLIGIW